MQRNRFWLIAVLCWMLAVGATQNLTNKWIAHQSAQYEHLPAIDIESLPLKTRQKLYLYEKDPINYSAWNKIIQCESGWNSDAVSKTGDYSLCQVNSNAWSKTASTLNLDFKNNWKDNIEFALWLKNHGGAANWKASARCHRVLTFRN